MEIGDYTIKDIKRMSAAGVLQPGAGQPLTATVKGGITMDQDRLFGAYKLRLMRTAEITTPGKLRFVVIQYLCSFPAISPYKMAASLANDGLDILFDNSAISRAEREAERRKFIRALGEVQQ